MLDKLPKICDDATTEKILEKWKRKKSKYIYIWIRYIQKQMLKIYLNAKPSHRCDFPCNCHRNLYHSINMIFQHYQGWRKILQSINISLCSYSNLWVNILCMISCKCFTTYFKQHPLPLTWWFGHASIIHSHPKRSHGR